MVFNCDTREHAAILLAACREKGMKLATAESCTGGLIVGLLTDVAGSSEVNDRGFVTYSNAAKCQMLNVPVKLFECVGAVSEEVACAMAEGAIVHSNAQVAASTTGIAGPGGGNRSKPVGLVHIAVARKDYTTLHERHVFKGGRQSVREQAVDASITLLLRMLAE